MQVAAKIMEESDVADTDSSIDDKFSRRVVIAVVVVDGKPLSRIPWHFVLFSINDK